MAANPNPIRPKLKASELKLCYLCGDTKPAAGLAYRYGLWICKQDPCPKIIAATEHLLCVMVLNPLLLPPPAKPLSVRSQIIAIRKQIDAEKRSRSEHFSPRRFY